MRRPRVRSPPRAPAKQIAETFAITALQGFSFSFDDNFDDSLTTVFVAHFCSHNWPAAPAKNRISLANTAFQDQCKCAIFEEKTPQKALKALTTIM